MVPQQVSNAISVVEVVFMIVGIMPAVPILWRYDKHKTSHHTALEEGHSHAHTHSHPPPVRRQVKSAIPNLQRLWGSTSLWFLVEYQLINSFTSCPVADLESLWKGGFDKSCVELYGL